ncbi:MAG: phage tail protein [Anaerolineae bacterium]|jgi:phage tail-like protein
MATSISPTQVSSYLEYLPAIFQQDQDEQGVTFIGRFLLAFEQILSGLDDDSQSGLEETIDRIHTYFVPGPAKAGEIPDDAERAPAEFLSWLAGWVALSLREDWTEEEKRRFISRIVPLYRQRGTKAGLEEMLKTYTGMGVEIYEFNQALEVGETTIVGAGTVIGSGPPHYFLVKMILTGHGGLDLARKEQIARAIIDREKPAHTYYDLQTITPTIRVGVHSTVGVDTLLGEAIEPS